MLNLLTGKLLHGRKSYPLRPELAESLYYISQALKDEHFWLDFSKNLVFTIENRTRTVCFT
jgi:mannosidase alpha-like ER degradation enhancer 2